MIDRPVPIVLAPLAGGPSTPALAAAVSGAGGFGFLGAGYLTAEKLADAIAETRRLTDQPFGVNLFVPGQPSPPDVAATYADDLRQAGLQPGEPRYSDDEWPAKLDLLAADPVAVVSFTFGCPTPDVVRRLQDAGSECWVTVTSPAEARQAADSGADAVVVQGAEAGGHRGSFTDTDEVVGLIALLQLVRAATDLPMIAAGGLMTGAAVAAVLACGASAAALGTVFLDSPEAGTSAVQRESLRSTEPTALTRAFTGRLARGIRNRFLTEHADAPSAYPEIHYVTAPLRAAARSAGDPELVNLWAGQAYSLARPVPAADLVRQLHEDARAAAADALRALSR
ncbi:NAD(P)H-dependent flavin oxidoreductase [Petropleomorpha daqingensis]|uniref:Propionate 3-nitronate monooxygenase n=1 Tax=Petropleomorpha daqingensis TaxID=2026353 RepID=A0A853C7F2_9ACTN|nr:nitronate monooxygenase [Petropleomorpha daqingensis]